MNDRRRLYLVLGLVAAAFLGMAVTYPLVRGLLAGEDAAAAGLRVEESGYSQIRARVVAGEVTRLTFHAGDIAVAEIDDAALRALIPPQVAAALADAAAAAGVEVAFSAEPAGAGGGSLTGATVLAVVGNLVILAGVGAAIYFLFGRRVLAGRGRPQVVGVGESSVRFADVAGCDAEKTELMEVVEFLRAPERFTRLGGRVPSGVLMAGPPGTGKTLLARAVAGEAGVPFISASGSDFVEMYVGVGASRVRNIFAKAKKKAPCIVFIDEIDAVGRSRSGAVSGGAHEEREQTLNQLLVEMDGFRPNSGVVVIAATNRPEILDKALMRPGRFSRQVALVAPDVAGRRAILAVHTRKVRLNLGVDLDIVARGTPGFSGADLANLVNEAAILAAREGRLGVEQDDFFRARDRILMGAERPMVLDEDDRRLTAFHEAGHALVALHCPASDPIHKVTIVPRGRALGMVVRLPERDRPAVRRSKLLADLAVAMGGRAAEELVFGDAEVSTGAAGDFQAATSLARRMVTEWGMSERLGAIFCETPSVPGDAAVSEETARAIDAEVRRLVDAAHEEARALLRANLHALHHIAERLLAEESLDGEEVAALAAAAPPARRALPA